jgi:hypothetical protein
MAERPKRRHRQQGQQMVQADLLGTTRVPPPLLEPLVHPDATPLHQIPQEQEVEVALSRVENLIGKGLFGVALREAKALQIQDSPLAAHYEFIRQEKVARTHIGIADRYFIRGDKDSARQFYARAIQPETTNATIAGVARLAEQTFEQLLVKRQDLVNDLKNRIREDSYADWCEKKNELQTTTWMDMSTIRTTIFPDFSLEGIFGELPPIQPTPGWVDPLPPEAEFVDFAAVTPGAVFNADTEKAITVDVGIPTIEAGGRLEEPGTPPSRRFEAAQNGRIRASVVMPILANVFIAKARLFAIDQGLTPAGQAQGVVPLFRYEYLRDKAKQIIAHIQDIESRMLPIQFKLDDFAEVVSTIRFHLEEQEAELEAVNQKISELMQTLTVLAQVEKEIDKVVQLLQQAQDECDCDWWCWLGAILEGAIVVAFGVALSLALGAIAEPLAGIGGLFIVGGILVAAKTITCDNVGEITTSIRHVQTGIRQAIQENGAELNYELTVRDTLIANSNTLSHELSEVYASNAARVLNFGTLNIIQAQYDSLMIASANLYLPAPKQWPS